MRALTYHEATVLGILRTFLGREVPVTRIKEIALDRDTRYDAVDRALRGLMNLGLVERTRRGYYRSVCKGHPTDA